MDSSDGSDMWYIDVPANATSMQVVMRPGIFGQTDTISLSEKISEFEEKNVESLKR